MQVSTIGLDLAKRVFQVHGIAASGEVVVRKRLRRSELMKFFAGLDPCVVGLEACGTAGHMTAPDLANHVTKSLANQGPSTHDDSYRSLRVSQVGLCARHAARAQPKIQKAKSMLKNVTARSRGGRGKRRRPPTSGDFRG